MQSTPKPLNPLAIFSIIQLVLGILLIGILYTAPFATYEVRLTQNTSTALVYYYTYETYGLFVGDHPIMSLSAAIAALMYLVFMYFSLLRILPLNLVRPLPLSQTLSKYAKFVPLLALPIIGCSILGIYGAGLAYEEVTWGYALGMSPSVGMASVFIGGILVAITGVIANRMSKPAASAAYGYAPQAMPQPAVPYAPQASYPCPTCGKPLTFVQQYNRWYCYDCQKYA